VRAVAAGRPDVPDAWLNRQLFEPGVDPEPCGAVWYARDRMNWDIAVGGLFQYGIDVSAETPELNVRSCHYRSLERRTWRKVERLFAAKCGQSFTSGQTQIDLLSVRGMKRSVHSPTITIFCLAQHKHCHIIVLPEYVISKYFKYVTAVGLYKTIRVLGRIAWEPVDRR